MLKIQAITVENQLPFREDRTHRTESESHSSKIPTSQFCHVCHRFYVNHCLLMKMEYLINKLSYHYHYCLFCLYSFGKL